MANKIFILGWILSLSVLGRTCQEVVADLHREQATGATLLSSDRCMSNAYDLMKRFAREGIDVSLLEVVFIYRQQAKFSGTDFFQDAKTLHLKKLKFDYGMRYHVALKRGDEIFDVAYVGEDTTAAGYFRALFPKSAWYGEGEDPLDHVFVQTVPGVEFISRFESNPKWEEELSGRASRFSTNPGPKYKLPLFEDQRVLTANELIANR